jgi:ectoine hydroxylase-related dioxygenase (phytanoyl-CoA dioxygenase family)
VGHAGQRLGRLDGREPRPHAIPLPVRTGSVVRFTAWTWHYSKNNTTDRVRRAFIVSYQEGTLTRGAGERWKLLRPAA